MLWEEIMVRGSQKGGKKATVSSDPFDVLDFKRCRVDDKSIKGLIGLSEGMLFFQRIACIEILSRKECTEENLQYVLKNSSRNPQREAAERLMKKFPSKENLGLIICYCREMRDKAVRMLEEKYPKEARAIFEKYIKKA